MISARRATISDGLLLSWILWTLGTALGWTSSPLSTMAVQLDSWRDVLKVTPLFMGMGLLAGAVIGLFQWLVLRRIGVGLAAWVSASALGHTFSALFGLLTAVALPSLVMNMRLGVSPLESQGFFITPVPNYVILGGYLIGVLQWIVLCGFLYLKTWRVGALWVIGTWAALGLGMFLGGMVGGPIQLIGINPDVGLALQRLITGAVFGGVTGAVLIIVTSQKEMAAPSR